MARLTEHLQDRPHDGPWIMDAARTAAVYFFGALALLAATWFIVTLGLQIDVLLAMAAVMQPERIFPPNPDAEDEAHDAHVQRKLDDSPRPQACHACTNLYVGAACPICKEERPAYTALKRASACPSCHPGAKGPVCSPCHLLNRDAFR